MFLCARIVYGYFEADITLLAQRIHEAAREGTVPLCGDDIWNPRESPEYPHSGLIRQPTTEGPVSGILDTVRVRSAIILNVKALKAYLFTFCQATLVLTIVDSWTPLGRPFHVPLCWLTAAALSSISNQPFHVEGLSMCNFAA